MKQIALSLFVIAASGAYVWDQAGKGLADDLLGAALPADAVVALSLCLRVRAPAAVAAEIPKQPQLLGTVFRTRFPIGKEATAAISAPAQTQPSPAAQSLLIPAHSRQRLVRRRPIRFSRSQRRRQPHLQRPWPRTHQFRNPGQLIPVCRRA